MYSLAFLIRHEKPLHAFSTTKTTKSWRRQNNNINNNANNDTNRNGHDPRSPSACDVMRTCRESKYEEL